MKNKYPPERKRVRISPMVKPGTKAAIDAQEQSQGVVIDIAVQRYIDELLKEEK